MNVLAIGNSFSEDATRYLHAIARADGETLNVVNLYIGGCSLELHYRNMLSGKSAYELQYNGEKTGFSVSIDEALFNRKWDVVTLQQVSSQSFNYDSYQPYITELAKHVRLYCPKAKLYVHQTWAYEKGSEKLLSVAKYDKQENMLADVTKAYAKAAKDIDADGIIPSGELFGNLIKSGIDNIYRDTYHAAKGCGRYALGLLWYRSLTGKTVAENGFSDFDEEIPEDVVSAIKTLVDQI